ncbi:MAG: hypothetical protein QOF84_3627 [Streptomyces sp.]|jgi:hypothetical protein|nr:hypothetical protein [Streptomyces sp.]
MEQNGAEVPAGFAPEEYERVTRAARLIGKDPQAFVRDAALAATEDPFLKALQHTGDAVTRLAPVFAAEEAGTAGPVASDAPWPDPAPMSSHDLQAAQHGHAA